jgi:hypothetical protein
MLKDPKTVHRPCCPECHEVLLCEFSNEELKQLVAGTSSFVCTNGNAHNSGADNRWPATKDEKDGFVKILLSP